MVTKQLHQFFYRSEDHFHPYHNFNRGEVVAQYVCWITGQQVKRSVLHMGHIEFIPKFLSSAQVSRSQYNLAVHNGSLKYHSFHFQKFSSIKPN